MRRIFPISLCIKLKNYNNKFWWSSQILPRYILAAEAVLFSQTSSYIFRRNMDAAENLAILANFFFQHHGTAPLCQTKLSPQCHMSRNRYFSCYVMCYVHHERKLYQNNQINITLSYILGDFQFIELSFGYIFRYLTFNNVGRHYPHFSYIHLHSSVGRGKLTDHQP